MPPPLGPLNGLPLILQNIFKKKTAASTVAVKPLFNFENAEYFMELKVSKWNGPAALQMSGITGIANLIGKVISSPALPGGNLIANAVGNIFSNQAIPIVQSIYALPICTTLQDTQSPKWEEKSLLEGTASALSATASGIVQEAVGTIGRGVASDMLTAGQVITGLAPNEFLTLLFKGPSFKKYALTWAFSPNNLDSAVNLRNMIREIEGYAAPELYTGAGNLLWKFPSMFELAFRKRTGPNKGPNLYKFKPAVVDQITVDYAGSGTPSFMPGGYPESIFLNISFHELEMWKSQDFSEENGWPNN